jgi:hypothetical protein
VNDSIHGSDVSCAITFCSNTVYRINLKPAGEYLLIENRQKIGYDQQLANGGLAIWHIDEAMKDNTKAGFPGGPNWPKNHLMIALLQADGKCNLERKQNSGDASMST